MKSEDIRRVDGPDWPRQELFSFFSPIDHPFYTVSLRLDVTKLYAYTKARGLSFYHALVYFCTHSLNSVENFRYTIRGGGVYLLPRREPSFTHLKPGSDLFQIITLPCGDSLEVFCRTAAEKAASQTTFLDQGEETDDLIYFSCLPWFDLTCCTNERNLDVDDAIPRICWGKFVDRDGHKELGLSIEVNHRLIDGVHIGRFYEALQQHLAALE